MLALPRYQAEPGNAFPEALPRSFQQIIKLKNQSNQLTTIHPDPIAFRYGKGRESGFSLRVIKRKTWGKKGHRKKVRGDRRKGRVNVMGAMRYSDKKRFVEFLSKSNSNSFYKVLKLFYNLIELVWHSAKEYIANRLFKSIEELEVLLHKLLNEGRLVIKWDENLKTKEMLSQFKCETAYHFFRSRTANCISNHEILSQKPGFWVLMRKFCLRKFCINS